MVCCAHVLGCGWQASLWGLSLLKAMSSSLTYVPQCGRTLWSIVTTHRTSTKAPELGPVTYGVDWDMSKRKTEMPVAVNYINTWSEGEKGNSGVMK